MEFACHNPFIHLLGAQLLRFEDGEAEIALTLRDELCNSWQVAHGGVVMTLLDVAMTNATRAPRKPDEGPDPRGVVTIEMKTTFMRPAQGRVVCIGRLLHRSAALAFCEGTLLNADGERLAHATGTFKFLSGLPAQGRRIQSPEASDRSTHRREHEHDEQTMASGFAADWRAHAGQLQAGRSTGE